MLLVAEGLVVPKIIETRKDKVMLALVRLYFSGSFWPRFYNGGVHIKGGICKSKK